MQDAANAAGHRGELHASVVLERRMGSTAALLQTVIALAGASGGDHAVTP
jgi:hypothetical protein